MGKLGICVYLVVRLDFVKLLGFIVLEHSLVKTYYTQVNKSNSFSHVWFSDDFWCANAMN